MISTVSRYIGRLFLMRFAILLLGLAALVVFLDFLADGDDVIDAGVGIVTPIARYTILRLPEIVAELIPITAMLAGFVTFAGLARHRELTAMLGAGISKFKLAAAVLPAAVLVAGMQFLIEDQAVPLAVGELRAWGVGDYSDSSSNTTWIRQGTDIVRIHRLDRAARTLNGVTIFRRDEAGNLLERIEADTAVQHGAGWTLEGVRRSSPGAPKAVEQERLDWPQGLRLDLLVSAATQPKETPLMALLEVSDQSDLGTQPGYRYKVWLNERLAGPVTSIVLILLTVALAQPFESRTGRGLLMAIWLGLGFVSWTFDGLVLTFGEIGLLPPALAAWTPVLVFAALAITIMLHDERRKVRRDHPLPSLGAG
jgi:lipopolysaccharide export system permease protein